MSIQRIQSAIQPLRVQLLEHPVYRDMRTAISLRTFMEYHVFAVWDFMSLLKSLQQKLCCVRIPWTPPQDAEVSRLINEIVLGEESDEDGRGGHASHFELYRQSMVQFGASTVAIDQLLCGLNAGNPLAVALELSAAVPPITDFVRQTFSIIESGDLCQVASAFTFGREDLLPDVFQRIVDEIQVRDSATPNEFGLSNFQYYLQRHIDLDGGDHGPKAHRLVQSLCGSDPVKWNAAEEAAVRCLESRIRLWDAIHRALRA